MPPVGAVLLHLTELAEPVVQRGPVAKDVHLALHPRENALAHVVLMNVADEHALKAV
jgi:hypothetical protein